MQERQILKAIRHASNLLPVKATHSVTFGIENLPSVFVPADVWQDWTDVLHAACQPLIEVYFDEAAGRFLNRVGASPDLFKVVNPYLSMAADKLTLDFCKETNQTTRLQLGEALEETREAVRHNLIEGDGMPELTEKVEAIFDQAETWRAKRIAVTESSRSIHQAELMSATASGNVAKMVWLASADACDEICMPIVEANPEGVVPGQPFAIGVGKNPKYSTIYAPPAHPGCQCSTTVQLTEDEAPGIALDDLQALADHWGLVAPPMGRR